MYCYWHLTKKRQKDEEVNVSKTTTETKDENERRRRKTKTKDEDERRKRRRSKKNRRKLKTFSKQMLVPKKSVWEKKRAPPQRRLTYLPSAGCFVCGPDGQTETSPNHWERLIKYHKCPTFDAKRETRNTKHETNERTNERKTPAIFRHLIDSPKQMI